MAGEQQQFTDGADAEVSLLKYSDSKRRKNKPKRRSCLCKCCLITGIVTCVLLLLAFLAIFVAFPVALRCSIELQRTFLFMSSDIEPDEFTTLWQYANATRHLYVTVKETENITLGVWHLLPEPLIEEATENPNFDYAHALTQPDYPVALHFHGNAGNRFSDSDIFSNLRKFFHIISFDYRGYGDSSKAELTEEGIVEDSVALYKWLVPLAARDNVYLWGHSLGSALSTHTVATLREENIVPMGLILEAPFTTLREAIEHTPLIKIFSWLPWFSATFQDGYDENEFYLKTTENILRVDCPIMILHAEDDVNVPSTLGEKLYRIAQEKRNPVTQGNVTFHLFPAKFNYEHWGITTAPEMGIYLRNFIDICQAYRKTKQTDEKNQEILND